MTVRTPVYWDGSAIREMSTAQMDEIKKRVIYLYGGSTSTTELYYTGSSGNLNELRDYRDRAGTESHPADDFNTSPGAADDAGTFTVRDHVTQATANGTDVDEVATYNVHYPLYVDGTNGLRAMSKEDFRDTFTKPVIEQLVDGNDYDGTYKVLQTNSPGDPGTLNHTLVSEFPIYKDTRFNIALHGGVLQSNSVAARTQEILSLSSRDQPDNGGDRLWYLWVANQGSYYGNPGVIKPLRWSFSDSAISTMSDADWDDMLFKEIQYVSGTNAPAGYGIRYEFRRSQTIGDAYSFPADPAYAGGWNVKGATMTDTTLNSDVVIFDQDGANEYRSQNLPTGSPEDEHSYQLMIYRI